MKTSLTFTLSGAVVCLAFAVQAAAQNRVFTAQYSFGDSLSDNGNLLAATTPLGAPNPRPPYFQGRFSNGPVFTEQLGNTLLPVLTVPATARGSFNFAFGGATAAGTSTLPPSMAVQLGLYQARGVAPARTDLFTVLFGANDMIPVLSAPTTATNPAGIDVAGASAAATVAGGVQTLIGLGAKNIVVGGLPNLGVTPRSLAAGSTGAAFGLRATTAFNNELTNRLRTLAGTAAAADVNLVYLDLQGVLDRIVLEHRALGFSNATSFAIAPVAAGGGGEANSYVFFDDIHPTAKTHAIVASTVVEALNPEPVLGFAATQGTAALALQSLAAGAVEARVAQLAATGRAAGRADIYASYHYGDGNRGAEGLRPKFGHTANVVLAGGDLRVGEGFLGGGAISSGRLRATVRGGGGNYTLEDITGRVYGVWRGGPVAFAFDAGYGNLALRGVRRTTAFAGFQTNGKAGGDHWGAGLKAIWTMEHAGLTLRPWAGLRTERVKLRAYTEKDVPVLAMQFEGQEAKSSAGSIGVDFAKETKLAARTLRLDFRAAWHGEMTDRSRAVAGRLADNFTRTTTISVEDGDGRGVELGGAATLFFAKDWSASLGYAGDIRSGEKLGSRASFSVQTGF